MKTHFCRKSKHLIILIFVSILFQCTNNKIIFDKIKVYPPDYWPTGEWRTSVPEKQGVKTGTLLKMFTHIKDKNILIDNITIVRNGYIITDAYFYPFKKNKKHIIHSCTKSITSALVGIAVDKGYIKSVKQPVLDFFPERTFKNIDKRKKAMTLEHLLTMTSGLDMRDSYKFNDQGFYEYLYSKDWTQLFLDKPMIHDPGTEYNYSTGISFLLSAIIQETTKMKTLAFARKHLFGPLGIKDVIWPESPRGINFGGSDMWMRPHDMAKIGLLFLNKGKWDGRQVISESWVNGSTRPHVRESCISGVYDYYGYQWRIVDEGYYLASGRYGQNIFVIPAKNMVVVFTSDLPLSGYYTTNELVNEFIVPAAVSDTPLPEDKKAHSQLAGLLDSNTKGPAKGFIWISEQEGAAKNGRFVRTVFPAFSFSFPETSKKFHLDAPGQVMSIRTPDRINVQASVFDIPGNMPLSEFGVKFYAAALGNIGSNARVTDNRKITLKDGTSAYKTKISWTYTDGTPLITWIVSAYKNGKCVTIAAHHNLITYRADPILNSLRL